jgi:hypothetical protein
LSNPYYQFSPSFVYNQINGGVDNGAYITDALGLMYLKGDNDIAEMPYSDANYITQPTGAQLEAAKPYRNSNTIGSFFNVNTDWPNPIDGVKQWLDSGKVLVMSIPIYADFPDDYGNPAESYYDYNGSSSFEGLHAVAIVGYDDNINPSGVDANHRGGFKMVNSWGSSWNGANAGYVYLSYDFVIWEAMEAWVSYDVSPDGPSISSLSSTSGKAGDTIHIYGNNFGTCRRAAHVSFNGTNASSPSFTNGDITATVPSGATTGPVTVYDWDGAASNGITFTTSNPIPTTISINPTNETGSGPFTLTVNGTNFVPTSVVNFNGNAKTTTYISATEVTANITAADIATAGTFPVTVTNPTPGGGTSNAQTFTVNSNPVPTTTSISPDHKTAGDSAFTLTVNGTNFVGSSVVNWNGSARATTYVSASQVTATIAAADIATAGTFPITVTNPTPGGGISNTLSFTVIPRPSISSLSPTSGTTGSIMYVNGSHFGYPRGSSYVKFGTVKVATYYSWVSTKIKVKVPSGISRTCSVTVYVSGVGTSNAKTFKVIPKITSTYPTSGKRGSKVTIYGTAFGAKRYSSSFVKFGTVKVSTYYSWSNTKIVVKVPSAPYSKLYIKVVTTGGTSAGKYYTVKR